MFSLPNGTVEVRYCFTDGITLSGLHNLTRILSRGERDRSARFMFDSDRRDFIAAHALLRTTMSQFAITEASDWLFTTTMDGKPTVDCRMGATYLDFNLSHTRGLVACVVARDTNVGIDVERVDRGVEPNNIAPFCLSSEESTYLLSRPRHAQPARLIEFWALKEAYLKGLACGLAIPPNALSFHADHRGKLSCTSQLYPVAPGWHFEVSVPSAGYRLAVAAQPRTKTLGGVQVSIQPVEHNGLAGAIRLE